MMSFTLIGVWLLEGTSVVNNKALCVIAQGFFYVTNTAKRVIIWSKLKIFVVIVCVMW
jgi:hypothetical protein